jgi:hypothetical protein
MGIGSPRATASLSERNCFMRAPKWIYYDGLPAHQGLIIMNNRREVNTVLPYPIENDRITGDAVVEVTVIPGVPVQCSFGPKDVEL